MAQSAALAAEVIQTAKRLLAIRQSVKRMGVPLTAHTIRPNPPIPSTQNAAPLYRQAYRVYQKQDKSFPFDWTDVLKPTRTPANKKAAQQALSGSTELLRLAEQIATRPRCDFNRPWENGADSVLMPELSVMRYMTRLLAAQATLQMEENNPLGAIESLKTGAMIARHAAEELVIIGHLVWAAIHRILHDAFDELLQRYGTYSEVIRAAEPLQQRLSHLPNLRHVFEGEACFVFSALESHRLGKEDVTKNIGWEEVPKRAYFTPVARTLYANAWEVRFLEFFQQLFREIETPKSTLAQAWKNLEGLSVRLESRIRSHPPLLSYLAVANVAPLYIGTVAHQIHIVALARLRQAALIALREQNATGKLPTILPDAPVDPFTDRPLVYRRTEVGFVLYSLSTNATDEGGDSRRIETGNYRFPKDIVLRYPK